MSELYLQKGEVHRFASIEDMIAVSNGEMAMSEARENYEAQQRMKEWEIDVTTEMVVTEIKDGCITFEIK